MTLLLAGCWDFSVFHKKICDTEPSALCDDFEEGVLDGKRWTVDTVAPNDSVSVDAVHVHSGKFALHSHVEPPPTVTGDEVAQAESVPTFAPTSSIFIRAFVFEVDPAGFGGRVAFFHNNVAGPGGGIASGPALLIDRGNYATVIPNGAPTVSTTTFPKNTWVCVEWEIDVAPTQQLRVFVNEQELGDLHTPEMTTATPPYQRVALGLLRRFTATETPTAGDAWYDDVVISTERQIGCGY
jgi:hypothetical protein